jgi:HK97 family phage major capsid protein
MELITKLVEQRAHAWEEAKKLLDGADTENRDLDAVEQEQWDRINGDLDGLDTRITDMHKRSEANKAADEMRDRYQPAPEGGAVRAGGGDVNSDEVLIRELVDGKRRSVRFEAEKRDLTKGTNSAGGFSVPTSFYGQLQEHMIANSAIRRTNATVLTTAAGEDIQIPKTTTHPSAILVAEGVAITESDTVFAQTTLGAFKYAFITQISVELEKDTGVDLVGYLARIGGEALGNGSGAAFVVGGGTTAPWGVVPRSTLGVTGAVSVAGVFTADNLIDLYYSVIDPYRSNGSWLLRDSSIATARKLKGSDNNYLWQPGLMIDRPDTLLGRPIFSDPNVVATATTAKSVVFGDFSKYFIRDVAGVEVDRSTDFAFNAGLVTYRFMLRTDGDLVDQTGAIKHFIGGAT